MSKKIYVGVDNKAKQVKTFYVGINNTARKIKKAYVGVNNTARQIWPGIVYTWKRYTINEITEYIWKRYKDNVSYTYTYSEKDNDVYGSLTMNGSATVYRFPELDKTKGAYYGDRSCTVKQFCETYDLGWMIKYQGATTSYCCGQGGYTKSGNNYTFHYSQYWTVEKKIKGTNHSKGSYIDDVRSTSRSAYPDDARNGSYWYNYNTSEIIKSQGSLIDTVTSDDPTAYPDNGISGKYWYVKQ